MRQRGLQCVQRSRAVGAPVAADERHHQRALRQQLGGVHQRAVRVRQQELRHPLTRLERLGGDLRRVEPLEKFVIGRPWRAPGGGGTAGR